MRGCPPKVSIHVNFQTGTPTDTADKGAETTTYHRELLIMPTYEVIVGNVGAVYAIRTRTHPTLAVLVSADMSLLDPSSLRFGVSLVLAQS